MCAQWIKDGLEYFKEKEAMVKKSFLVCGITNDLDGSENSFINCAKELPTLQVDESNDDPFQESDSDESKTECSSNDKSD